jgi:1-acyl-sn-glycerol-3-phosphate acyltransferase
VKAGVPVVPVVLRGNREMLPDGTWWPRPAALEVELCAPIAPAPSPGDAFAAALGLRTAVHRAIAQRLLAR